MSDAMRAVRERYKVPIMVKCCGNCQRMTWIIGPCLPVCVVTNDSVDKYGCCGCWVEEDESLRP